VHAAFIELVGVARRYGSATCIPAGPDMQSDRNKGSCHCMFGQGYAPSPQGYKVSYHGYQVARGTKSPELAPSRQRTWAGRLLLLLVRTAYSGTCLG
jgi:hypothetical protein